MTLVSRVGRAAPRRGPEAPRRHPICFETSLMCATKLVCLLTLTLGSFAVGCGSSACSPCPPDKHASDPTKTCSACITNEYPPPHFGDASPDAADVGADGDDATHATPDADSGVDANADAAACDVDARIWCAYGGPAGGFVSCGDVVEPATCDHDQWSCPFGMINAATCDCAGLTDPRLTCQCTATGWRCSADGGTDADASPDTPPS
jgi:hypothetical protein